MTSSTTPSPSKDESSSDYYYLVVTVAVIALMLVLSNAIAFACCSPRRFLQTTRVFFCCSRGANLVGNRAQQLIPVCKYRKEQEAFDTECSVCLTGFMEGEEVRQLPSCKHSFHAPCIDMWLYSHASCPLCRANVVGLPPPAAAQCPARANGEDLRQIQVSESRGIAGVAVALM